ncbi:disulfide bond formation protein B [Sulfuritalea hydrogenivorans]|uniref:Disulphide bond formation protein DsbB n=1 Tax=Sulfuritalea hydrogenivorans sk43H TaxID=1223802 RepID=W0SHW3_9PROT|nr:disulfide bond formation protein B [Sulfuritalea hydrogenivorans]BAO29523.1 disulphide bond formation protein DsbB [Sulfuritalea hydrogenivorans sk43H]
MDFLRLLFTPRGLFAATGLAALGLVAGGVVLAQTLNLAACPLCILQRMLYLLLALEAAAAWKLAGSPPARRAAALVMLATTLAGVWIAAYQTWLQRFAKGVSCTADQPWWEAFVNWAGSQWPLLFEASGLCSEAGWKFIGLSIAEWSLIAFTSMSIAMLMVLLRRN